MQEFSSRLMVLLCSVLLPLSILAQSNQVPFGARPTGLGDAFVGVADDGNALYWNPAGIATLSHHEFNSMTANSFNIGLKHRFLSYVFPLTDKHSLGLSWLSEGFSDQALNFGWNIYQLSYGRNIWQKLSLGMTFKYAEYSVSEDKEVKDKPSGVGFDLGVLYNYRKLRFGFMAQDLTNLELKHSGGFREEFRKRALLFGISCEPIPNLLIASALTVNDRLHFGAEYWGLGNKVALLAGLQRDIYDTPAPEIVYSAGASLKYSIFQFDYAYSMHPTLPSSHRFSISAAYSFSRSKVLIKDFKINPLFASRYIDYSDQDIGRVVIENRESVPVTAEINLSIPSLMDKPESILKDTLFVRAHNTMSIPVKATLSAIKAFKTQDNHLQAIVEVAYVTSDKARYRKKGQKSTKFIVYAPGAVSWAKGPAAAASFVTHNDPAIKDFAQSVLQPYGPVLAEAEEKSNLLKAALVFDALGKMGIRYQADTDNPFSKVSGDSIAVDNIRYPRHMMQRNVRFGDCDDLTVLLASLLEAVNIETAVAMAPGHLYLFFNTGIPRRAAENIFADPDLRKYYYDEQEKIWIPLETTRLGQSFWKAVKAGASNKAESIAEVHKAWKDYQPAFPSDVTEAATPPPRELVDELFKSDHEMIVTRGITEYLSKLENLLTSNPNDASLLVLLGKAYYEAKELQNAAITLQKAVSLNSKAAEARFLLGLAYLDQNESENANEQATHLQTTFPADLRGYLLMALAYFAQKQYQQADEWYQRAKQADADSPLLMQYNIPLWIETANKK